MSSRTNASSTRIVASRTKSGDVNARVGFSAEEEAGLESQTSATVVVGFTTSRNRNALLLRNTPAGISNSCAFAAATKIEIIGASSGNVGARICGGAPSEPRL